MTREEPEPLGPDSLTWKYFGDWRGLLIALWAGSMQNMHPGLGAGVEQHSRFFEERWQRLFRSLYPIGGVVYDGPRAHRTALEVRGYHDRIKGVDGKGRRYHALDPDTFYWAHSTFFVSTILIADHFMGGIGEEEKRTLFDEHVRWWRMYDMTMRPVPESWEDFQRYWKHMCAEVLEDNKATRDVLDLRGIAKPPFLPWLPELLWKPVSAVIAKNFVWLTVGLYDQEVRDLLGYRWTARDERRHRRAGKLINAAFAVVPRDRRYHPRARAGWRRARGELASNAPLVETPRRNLPPLAERGRPEHYSPDVP
ncbi:oxygenase MpaB family protein [Amycolatopsis benzoatilytica]|uniref:oxygenase MpaB family protein n=1 Tax=Amycolatopsis benzoatilytica TaxID=346045 RepID=UPI00037DE58B|nr:oxygenase MpaB family protein [Amycolatopsis benzoatilytica]